MTETDPVPDQDEPGAPVYTIGITAQILAIHPQTLRMYERLGLVKPKRSSGRRRMYSKNDLSRLQLVLQLTRDRGINLAGVELFLDLQEQMNHLQTEMEEILTALRGMVQRDPSSGSLRIPIPIEYEGKGED